MDSYLESVISIHALLAESDPGIIFIISDCWIFLSTLSLRRATPEGPAKLPKRIDFYPRSPCGERRRNGQNIKRRHNISIHALLAESDICASMGIAGNFHFYPRSPCGERQNGFCKSWQKQLFLSTLSLRRATGAVSRLYSNSIYFYPRSPCGERQVKLNRTASRITFLSTLSLRRATLVSMLNSPNG